MSANQSISLVDILLRRLDSDRMRRSLRRVAEHIVDLDDTSRGVGITALLASAVLVAIHVDMQAGGLLPQYQYEVDRWVGDDLRIALQLVDFDAESGWLIIVEMAVALQQRSAADPELASKVTNLLARAEAVNKLFEIANDRYRASLALLRRFHADMLDDEIPEVLYPPSFCRTLLKHARLFVIWEVS